MKMAFDEFKIGFDDDDDYEDPDDDGWDDEN